MFLKVSVEAKSEETVSKVVNTISAFASCLRVAVLLDP